MNNRKPRLICCFLFFAAIAFSVNITASFSAEGTVSSKPSLEEIQRDNFKLLQDKWKEYTLAIFSLKATSTHKRFSKNGTPIYQLDDEYDEEFESHYPCYSSLKKYAGESYASVFVWGKNERFALCRANDLQSWSVDSRRKEEDQKPLEDWNYPNVYLENPHSERAGYYIFNSLALGLKTGCVNSLPATLSIKGLSIDKLEYTTLNGKEVLYMDVKRVEYEKSAIETDGNEAKGSKNKSARETYNIHGQFWLDTDYFLVVKSKCREVVDVDQILVSEVTIDYQTACGLPLPKSYRKETNLKDKPSKNKQIDDHWAEEIEFHSFEKNDDCAADRFTLAHYGVSESAPVGKTIFRNKRPAPKKKPGAGLRWSVLAVGIVLVGIGAGLYSRRKRAV